MRLSISRTPNRRLYMAVGIFILLIFSQPFLSAQNTSQLVAINTAQQDAIVLYDINNDTYQTLRFHDEYWHHVWDFSPDGCRILFTLSHETQPAKLFHARLDGSDVVELVQYDELASEEWGIWEADWSPDGERIAFKFIRDGYAPDGQPLREYHISWVTPDGGVPTLYSATGREHSPVWSPDGEWLAYVSYDERVKGASTYATATPEEIENPNAVKVNEADMWVVSANSETKYRLTSYPIGSVSKPTWSPNSQYIAFVHSPEGNNDTFRVVENTIGATPIRITQQWSQILDLTWTPDSRTIISATRDFNDINQNRLWQIPIISDAESASSLYLANLSLSHTDYPRFSPDGKWLLTRTAYELILVNLQIPSTQFLDNNLSGNTPIVWSPANEPCN